MTNTYIVSIGSNFNSEANVAQVQEIFSSMFEKVRFSLFRWIPPIGKHYTQPFYNGAVQFECKLNATELKPELKAIEVKLGRTSEQKLHGIVPMDLDIITCNGVVIHIDYERFPFVKESVDSLLIYEKE